MAHSYGARRVARDVASAGALALVLVGCGARDLPVAAPEVDRAPGGVALTPAEQPGDMAPHEKENNGWKQRATLTPEDQQAAVAAAARIRPALEQLRRAGDFRPESTRSALADLGYHSDDIQVRAFRRPAALPTDAPEPTGAVYGVRVGERGCVFGDVSPKRTLADVDGPTMEWGCIEPDVSH